MFYRTVDVLDREIPSCELTRDLGSSSLLLLTLCLQGFQSCDWIDHLSVAGFLNDSKGLSALQCFQGI